MAASTLLAAATASSEGANHTKSPSATTMGGAVLPSHLLPLLPRPAMAPAAATPSYASAQPLLKDHKKKRSKYRGVTLDSRRSARPWVAYIYVDRKRKHLGNFATEEEGGRAYDAAAREYHGPKAFLNFRGDEDIPVGPLPSRVNGSNHTSPVLKGHSSSSSMSTNHGGREEEENSSVPSTYSDLEEEEIEMDEEEEERGLSIMPTATPAFNSASLLLSMCAAMRRKEEETEEEDEEEDEDEVCFPRVGSCKARGNKRRREEEEEEEEDMDDDARILMELKREVVNKKAKEEEAAAATTTTIMMHHREEESLPMVVEEEEGNGSNRIKVLSKVPPTSNKACAGEALPVSATRDGAHTHHTVASNTIKPTVEELRSSAIGILGKEISHWLLTGGCTERAQDLAKAIEIVEKGFMDCVFLEVWA